MSIVPESSAFNRGVTPLLQLVLPGREESVLHYQADAALAQRIEELAEKSTEGELTEQEQSEYAGYVRANKFVAVMKRQAARRKAADADNS